MKIKTENIKLDGEVIAVIFRSEDTGYTVMDVKTEDAVFTVVGVFPPVSEGSRISVLGGFKTGLYGKQFVAEKAEVFKPSHSEGIRRFLGSGLIKGLGPVTAAAIVDKYGADALEKMQFPIEIAKVGGISLKKATEFSLNYDKIRSMQESMVFLQEIGMTVNLALKIYKFYERKTEDTVRKNPYKLVEDIDGVGFHTADKIAENLGITKESDYRFTAGIAHVLKEAALKGGHSYLPDHELFSETAALLGEDIPECESRVKENVEDMILLGDLVRRETDGGTAIMLKQHFMVEKNTAKKLVMLAEEAADIKIDVTEAVKSFEKYAGFGLHENQVAAVKASVENGVQIITGGPGTGKTTIIKCTMHVFANLGKNVVLCAPTGRAAKRLSAATGRQASTVHRLLELDWKDGAGKFTYNENRPLEAEVVIVDEVSMLDEYIFNALLKAMQRGARLVLVGDKDQLPSVGVGNVLSDLIGCEKFPVVSLTQIYRQSEDSKIVPNAHKINRGEMPDLDNKSADFFFEEKAGGEEIGECTLELITKRLPAYLKTSARDIQVLSAMKRGGAGTLKLNAGLQKMINPPALDKKEMRQGENLFREGDKIMQIQNNYKQEWTQERDGFTLEIGAGVFNGDIGTIESIDYKNARFTIRFDDDKVALYAFPDAEQLTLAYAVTIHKSQGSEFDAVVIALDANYMLQTRNLLYTAVTRAKKMVVIVGEKKTVYRMIKNNETAKRYSLLIDLINEEHGKRLVF